VTQVAGILGVTERTNNVDDFCDLIVQGIEKLHAGRQEEGEKRAEVDETHGNISNENQRLTQDISDKEEIIAASVAKQKHLDVKISELQQDYYELVEAKAHLEKSFTDLQAELKETQEKTACSATEVKNLSESCALKEGAIFELENHKLELSKKLEEMEKISQAHSSGVASLKNILLDDKNLSQIVLDVKSLQNVKNSYESLKSKLVTLTEQHNSAQSLVESFKSQVEGQNADNEALKEKLAEVQNKLITKVTEAEKATLNNGNLESNLRDLTAQTELVQLKLKKAEEHIVELQQQLENKISERAQFEEEISQLNVKIETNQSSSETSESRIEDLNRQLENVTRERDQYMTQVTKLNEKITSIESTQEPDEKLTQLQEQLQSAEGNLSSTRTELERVNSALQKKEEEPAGAGAERTQLVTALQQKHQESVAYHGEVQRLAAVCAQSQADHQTEIGEARKQLDASRSYGVNLDNQVQALKVETLALDKQLKQSKQEQAEQQKELRTAKQEAAEFQKKLQLLTNATVIKEAQESEKSAAVEQDLRRQLQETAKSLLKHGSEREASEESFNKRLSAMNEEFVRRENEMHEKVQVKDAEISELKVQLMSVTAELEGLQKEASEQGSTGVERAAWEYEARLSEAHKEAEALAVQLDEARKQASKSSGLAVTEAEVQRLGEEVSALQKEREHLRTANEAFNRQYEAAVRQVEEARQAEARSRGEAARLKQHLVEVEDSHTTDALELQRQAEDLKASNAGLEERLEAHSRLLSSTSSRASSTVTELQKEVQTLQGALQRVQEGERGERESAERHKERADTLARVLEEFQRAQERELGEAVTRERGLRERAVQELQESRGQLGPLQTEVTRLSRQLQEASDEVQRGRQAEHQAKELRLQVERQEAFVERSRQEVATVAQRSGERVDRELLRNLFLGYMTAAEHERAQVLPVLANVLGMSGEQRGRLGLQGAGGRGWMTSIADFLAPPASNVRVTSKVDLVGRGSLSDALVRYMEEEGKGGSRPTLPAVKMAQDKSNALVSTAEAGGSNALPQTVTLVTPSGGVAPSPSDPPAPPDELAPPEDLSTPLYLSNLLQSDLKPNTPARDFQPADSSVV